VAKANNVHEINREVKQSEVLHFGPGMNLPEPYIVNYVFSVFSINKINNRETVCLEIRCRTVSEVNAGRSGRSIIFAEQDFARLKQIFSDEYLAQFDKMEEERKKKLDLFQ
jgi:hypothetical protein